MNKSIRVSLFIALAGLTAPAFAQQDAPPPPPPAAVAPAPGAAPQALTPSQIVDREFSNYDLNKDGQLDAAEFSAWVTKLRKPNADGTPAADSQTWSASLFARADTDHNQQVSKTEMTALLTSAARG